MTAVRYGAGGQEEWNYDSACLDCADLRAAVERLTAQRDAAEKVCEAAERFFQNRAHWHDEEGLRATFTEWRRTKDANTGHSTQV